MRKKIRHGNVKLFADLKNDGVAVNDDDHGHEDSHDEEDGRECETRAPAYRAGVGRRIVVEATKKERERERE